MGFTIDITSGEVLEESTSRNSEKPKVNEHSSDISEYTISEQLISVHELEIDPAIKNIIPDSIAQADVESFIDKFS